MSDLTPEQVKALEEEQSLLAQIRSEIDRYVRIALEKANFDEELLALRDQIAEARLEDQPPLIEQMMRLSSLRAAQAHEVELPADPLNPYFAHLRLSDEVKGQSRIRDVFIGKRAFIDQKRGVHIVDWRNSPISRIYYCYHEGDEYEERFAGELQTGVVDERRTLTIARGEIKRLTVGEDVLMQGRDGQYVCIEADQSKLSGGCGTAARLPAARQARLGRLNPDQRLPEITALIDPAQFKAITDSRSGVIIIRGGAGTGKTTIALHRAAWLHFQDPKRFAGKRMLMITPGEALRRYVSQLLPSLDVRGVVIKTFETFARDAVKRLMPDLKDRPTTDETPQGARRLKRHPVILNMIERYMRQKSREYDDDFKEIGGPELEREWVKRRNLPLVPRVQQVKRFLETPEGQRMAQGRMLPLRQLFDQIMEELASAFELWSELLTNKARIAEAFKAANEQVYEWEIKELVETVAAQSDDPLDLSVYTDETLHQGVDGKAVDAGELRGKLDADDYAILLRIYQLQYGRLKNDECCIEYEHIIVDEAQDLSPLCLKLLCETVRPGGPVTLAGDEAQRIVFDSGFERWDELLSATRIKAELLPPLAISYRSTRQVMELARSVLPDQVGTPSRDARDGAEVQLLRFDEQGEAVAFLADALKSLRSRERLASVALIAKTSDVASLYYSALKRADVPNLRRVFDQEFDFTPGIDVTDVYQVKGLEYDYVILLEVTAEQYPDAIESRHLFHVAATRAAHQLWLICTKAPSLILPETLRNPESQVQNEPAS